MDSEIRTAPEKKLTREQFYAAIEFVVKLLPDMGDAHSLVFHSSTALRLLEDVVKRRNGDELKREEVVTNDIDAWISVDLLIHFVQYLQDKKIPFQIEQDEESLHEGIRNLNLQFTYQGTEFDFWTSRGTLISESGEQDGALFREDDVIDLDVALPSGEHIPARVLQPAALRRWYEKIKQHNLTTGSPKAADRDSSQQRAGAIE